MNYEYQETYEFNPEFEGEFGYEMHENELAQELMGIQNEEELEYFLGNLLKSAWSGAKSLYNSPLGQQLKSQAVSGLRSLGRQVLPRLGSAAGGRLFGATGARLGGQLGNMAARGLGLEFEGAPPRDRRFEASKRLVRVARIAAKNIAAYARSGKPMNARVIRGMILQAGRNQFPGLPASSPGSDGFPKGGSNYQQSGMDNASFSTSQNKGTWYRQGNRIILQGV
ncbi:MAG: hypothetical protein ACKV1O_10160 [Saprospiraceae bacterium]